MDDRNAREMANGLKVDRSAFEVDLLGDDSSDNAYWHSRPALDRLRALEMQRRIVYGYTDDSIRLRRVLEVADRAWG